MTANKTVPSTREHSGIYVHIPFCVKKCNYCAFVSQTSNERTREQYVKFLLKEIDMRADRSVICDTLFLGGGTPSLLTPEQIKTIIEKLRGSFDIKNEAEITIEANPGTVDSEKLLGFRKAGVTRLSLGVQSMDDGQLETLGRIHDSAKVIEDFGAARQAGFDNINLDIMFAIPGTKVSEAVESLKKAISLNPDHISYYDLQLEEGTEFYRDFMAGTFKEVSDDDDREMYHRGRMLLKESGYRHYEISNFAKPGAESRHNSKYWNMADYYGFGLAASSFVEGVRTRNCIDMAEYRHMINSGKLPYMEVHRNTERDNISEAVFTGLRRSFGIKYSDILGSKESFWEYYFDIFDEIIEYEKRGYVLVKDDGIELTGSGIDISNSIMALFV